MALLKRATGGEPAFHERKPVTPEICSLGAVKRHSLPGGPSAVQIAVDP